MGDEGGQFVRRQLSVVNPCSFLKEMEYLNILGSNVCEEISCYNKY